MDEVELQIISNIQDYGLFVAQIPEDDDGPAYAFSIGLYKTYNHSEVVISGLSIEKMADIINVIAENIKQGKNYSIGKKSDDILEGYECLFGNVAKEWYKEFFGYAVWFYNSYNFPFLQCIWPDEHHLYPWDERYNKDISKQLLLISG